MSSRIVSDEEIEEEPGLASSKYTCFDACADIEKRNDLTEGVFFITELVESDEIVPDVRHDTSETCASPHSAFQADTFQTFVFRGEDVTVQDLFPLGCDSDNRLVGLSSWDMHLNLKRIRALLEDKQPKAASFRRHLHHIQSLLLDGLRNWDEYVRARNNTFTDSGVAVDDFEQIVKFDAEYRRFLQRRYRTGGAFVLNSQAKIASPCGDTSTHAPKMILEESNLDEKFEHNLFEDFDIDSPSSSTEEIENIIIREVPSSLDTRQPGHFETVPAPSTARSEEVSASDGRHVRCVSPRRAWGDDFDSSSSDSGCLYDCLEDDDDVSEVDPTPIKEDTIIFNSTNGIPVPSDEDNLQVRSLTESDIRFLEQIWNIPKVRMSTSNSSAGDTQERDRSLPQTEADAICADKNTPFKDRISRQRVKRVDSSNADDDWRTSIANQLPPSRFHTTSADVTECVSPLSVDMSDVLKEEFESSCSASLQDYSCRQAHWNREDQDDDLVLYLNASSSTSSIQSLAHDSRVHAQNRVALGQLHAQLGVVGDMQTATTHGDSIFTVFSAHSSFCEFDHELSFSLLSSPASNESQTQGSLSYTNTFHSSRDCDCSWNGQGPVVKEPKSESRACASKKLPSGGSVDSDPAVGRRCCGKRCGRVPLRDDQSNADIYRDILSIDKEQCSSAHSSRACSSASKSSPSASSDATVAAVPLHVGHVPSSSSGSDVQRDSADASPFVSEDRGLQRAISSNYRNSEVEDSAIKFSGHVEIINFLGCGGEGKVFLGRVTGSHGSDVDFVAVKEVLLEGARFEHLFRLMRLEVTMLKQLSHPNIVAYHGYTLPERKHSRGRCYHILIEYVDGGTLSDLLKSSTEGCGLSPFEVIAYVTQILRGLDYLHKHQIIHRDLKPSNILLTKDHSTIKISDFGVATQVAEVESLRRSCIGTPWYMAPEVILLEPYSFKADIWSLGCVTLELVTGKRPYHDSPGMHAMFQMVQHCSPPIPERKANGVCLSLDCLDFLRCCFRESSARPTAEELLRHPFLTSRTC
eukprot:GILK01005219.1.p1 GENE.GILK01005219.1~~GILK01005219.1.p1  ORF type:complete len:1034 (+),score=99.99 GILK01005219.1:88-3189(+)